MSDDNVRHLPVTRPESVEQLQKPSQIQSDRVTKAKARHRVLELAAAGLTDEQIAWETGKTSRGVRQTIDRQLKKWGQDNSGNLENYRSQKLFELDQLKRAVWPEALRGDTKAIREATKIITIQAGISGAGAASKHEHDHRVGPMDVDENEVRRMERAWVDAAPGQIPLLEDAECDLPDPDDIEDAVIVEGTVAED